VQALERAGAKDCLVRVERPTIDGSSGT